MLPFQNMVFAAAITAFANGLIVLAFWLFERGLRQLYGETPGTGWRTAVVVSFVFLSAGLFAHKELLALLYACGQIAPMLVMLLYVMDRRRRSVGSLVAAGGLVLGVSGHAVVIGMNLVILGNESPVPNWSGPAALTMFCVIFSGLLLNFGFAVLGIDHLLGGLEKLATTDQLTGTPNRRGLEALIVGERHAMPKSYGILLLDLDDFKSVNDRFGHEAGDRCLVHFSGLVRAQLNASDIFGRWGGDEFCVLIPDANLECCDALAAAIKASLAASPLLIRGQKIPVNCSIGASVWQVTDDVTRDAAFARADEAMYAHKHRRAPRSRESMTPPEKNWR